jgi:P4 family phage/plasmid primase-like protien
MNSIPLDMYNYRTNDLTRFFSIRNKHQDEMIPVKEDKKEIIERLNLRKKTTVSGTTGAVSRPRTMINYDLAQVTEIVNILDVSRADNYNTWIEVGWTLHNIDSELLDLWILFSRKSHKFVEGECERHWDKMKNEGLGIGSLYHWAKIDNYEKYKEIMDRDTNQLLNKTVESITNWDIANVLFKLYRYDFKYSCGEWYMFKNHLWKPMREAMELRQKISTELVNRYMRLISDYNRIGASDDPDISEEEKEEYKKKGKKVMEIIKNLKTTSFKENLIKECKELFNDSKFLEKLDSNVHLIGFNNGIYDLEKMELRDGRPDDYVSFCTGIDKIDFTTEHEYWEPLNIFLSSTITDNEVRNYFLTYLSSCLSGEVREQKLRVWTGSGGNGKSIINKLFQLAFGEYCINLPITLLTQKRANSNAPTPEIVQTKGKRFAYLDEPNEEDKMNVGLMKNYTGGDKIKGRGLNKDPIEFTPQFKMALLCNDVPKLPPNDGGVWRRMEIVEFKSKFVLNPREDNEFRADPDLERNLPLWAELFMSLLIDRYYANYKLYGIHVPSEVTKYTEEFQKQSDNYFDFISQALEETIDKTDIINVAELYDEFRVWYSEEFSEHKPPSRVEFKKYLKKKYKDNVISGGKEIKKIRFRTDFERKTDQQINIASPNVMNGVIGAGASTRSVFSS